MQRSQSILRYWLLMWGLLGLSSAAFTEQFSVLAFNIQMRPVLDNNSFKAPRISPLLNSYDVVALQESFSHKNKLMEYVEHPFAAHFTDKRHALSIVDSGLTTLSRFPIIHVEKEMYEEYAGFSDSLASKGMLLTRLNIDGMILDVYDTHMQAGYTDSENRARRAQARQMIRFINKHSKAEHSVLVLGDFNMSPQRPGLDWRDFSPNHHYEDEEDMLQRTASFQMIIDELFLKDVQDELQEDKVDDIERMLYRSGAGHSFTPKEVRKDYDHFMDENHKPLSDGAPIVVDFELKRRNGYESFTK